MLRFQPFEESLGGDSLKQVGHKLLFIVAARYPGAMRLFTFKKCWPQIPIRTERIEDTPGFLEVDTVAPCGGSVDDRHGDFQLKKLLAPMSAPGEAMYCSP